MARCRTSALERAIAEGESPVWRRRGGRGCVEESSCLGMQLKMGGKFHLRLNMGRRPIANKYREGKMKSTLERE